MSEQTRPGFGKRFWRALIRLLALVTFLVLLGGIAAAAYFGSIELQRSFNSVYARIEANEQTAALLRSDVNDLMGNEEQLRTVADMQATITALEAQLEAGQSALTTDLAAQGETLTALADTVDTAIANAGSDISMINEGLTALQSDITENGSRIDALGGELDALSASVATLDGDVSAVTVEQEAMMAAAAETAVADLSELQRALSLFRVSELIARARLRLLENNAGLAQTDVETAVATLDALIAASAPEAAAALETVQARLALAFVALPDSPDSALTDLETAWNDLDQIFVNEMLVVEAAAADETAEEAEGEADAAATPEAEATPEVEATPDLTPTPAPEATPAATPTPTATP